MSVPIRAVIIDDEPEACDNLKNILTSFISVPVSVCGAAWNTAEGDKLVQQYQPDIVFLDVEMPNEHGFAYLERVAPFSFEVIFVTAYDAYAVKAFKMNAIDYILKPIDIDDLENAMKKAADKIAYKYFKQNSKPEEQGRQEDIRTVAGKEKILVRNGNDVEIVEVKQILYVEANWSYSDIFFLKNGELKKCTMSYSLATYEEMLAGQSFFRIHKSYLVNTTHIKKITKDASPVLVLTNDMTLPVGRRRYPELMSFLKH